MGKYLIGHNRSSSGLESERVTFITAFLAVTGEGLGAQFFHPLLELCLGHPRQGRILSPVICVEVLGISLPEGH